jgi:C_GCAxxG_C_C family probable redox protein
MVQLAGKGYCCSQILMILALEEQAKSEPDLVRSMAGLCHGVGGSGGVCGVLTGAACVLSLYGAKGSDEEQADRCLPLMLTELVDWFTDEVSPQYGGILCSEIMGDADVRTLDLKRCGNIAIETYDKIMQILVDNGFDPALGKTERDD